MTEPGTDQYFCTKFPVLNILQQTPQFEYFCMGNKNNPAMRIAHCWITRKIFTSGQKRRDVKSREEKVQ